MNICKKIGAVLAVSMAVAAGSAGATTFTFGNGVDDQSSLPFGPTDGIDLTVSTIGSTIHQNRSGLGVAGGAGNNRLSGTEALTFSFSSVVELVGSLVYERRGGTDILSITGGGVTETFTLGQPGGDSTEVLNLSGLGLVGNSFTFQRTGGTGGTSGVRISQLTVAAVPLPATLPLLAFGVGGLVLAARRRKQKAV